MIIIPLIVKKLIKNMNYRIGRLTFLKMQAIQMLLLIAILLLIELFSNTIPGIFEKNEFTKYTELVQTIAWISISLDAICLLSLGIISIISRMRDLNLSILGGLAYSCLLLTPFTSILFPLGLLYFESSVKNRYAPPEDHKN